MKRPDNYTELDCVMSNFDHMIDKEIELKLKTGAYYAGYGAENFFGEVWWGDNKWNCDIWVLVSYIETFIADTLEEMMTIVCEKYGSE